MVNRKNSLNTPNGNHGGGDDKSSCNPSIPYGSKGSCTEC